MPPFALAALEITQTDVLFGLLLVLVGAMGAFLNVLAGGGSLLTMPVLVFIGLPGPVVNGTNRVGILAQTWSAAVAFKRLGHSELRLSLLLAGCAIPGAVAGAFMGVRLEGVAFNIVLAALLLLVAASMIHKPRKDVLTRKPPPLWLGCLLMVGVGVYAGFILAASGLLIIFALHRIMGWDLVRVNVHKVFIMGCCTVVSLAVFVIEAKVHWGYGAALALGNVAGAWLGAHVAVARGEKLIRPFVVAVLLVLAARLAYTAWNGS